MSLLVSVALPLAVAMAGKVAAAGRARESQRPDRLFDDPYAALLAGADRFRWMSEWRLPGMPAENPVIGPRTRFFDDLVAEAMGEGLRQIVLVAAGTDTGAFRPPPPDDAIVFELDQAPVPAGKQQVLDAAGNAPACLHVAAPADLADDDWPEAKTSGPGTRSLRFASS